MKKLMNMVLFIIVANLLLCGSLVLCVYTFTFGGVDIVDFLLGKVSVFEIPQLMDALVLVAGVQVCCVVVEEIKRVSLCKL